MGFRRRLFSRDALRAVAWCAVCIAGSQCGVFAESPSLIPTSPQSLGLDESQLNRIDAEVGAAIDEKQLPGAVVAVGFQGQLVFLRAYGHRQLQPHAELMTTDTVFDLASLTKPLVTACGTMKLVEQGKLGIDDPVSEHLPEFAVNGKHEVTVRQLLLHISGLIPDNSLQDYEAGREDAFRKVMELPLNYQPGERFRYSDVGFIVLGRIIELKSGMGLAQFASEHFFLPLSMKDTGFCPDESHRVRAAATEQREGKWAKGEVHDPRAYAMGGVAGHAGLFSTASDIAVFARMLLSGGQHNGQKVLSSDLIDVMTASYPVPDGIRGLGWDKRSAYSSNRGATMSDRAYGHGGFTGTGLWIDPELQLFVVVLSNRVHLEGKTAVNPLIGRIGTIAADAAAKALQSSGSQATR